MYTKIIGTGSYLPTGKLTNDDIAKLVDTNDEWIKERTGIGSRHIATDDTTVSMAVKASKKALEAAKITADDLDLIIVGTISADDLLPSTACRVQDELKALNACAFDVNAACSGFMYAYTIADSMIKNSLAKKALIIGVETLSKITDWSDRGTCILFGDGAGAAIIEASDDKGMLAVDIGSDGTKADALYCHSRSNTNPLLKETDNCSVEDLTSSDPLGMGHITMNGPEVFKFAIKQVPVSIEKVLCKSDIAKKDIDIYLLHQANMRIIASISKRLKIDISKFPHNMEDAGNTSAASIPILLDKCIREEIIKPDMKVLIAGFGAGLTWSAAVIQF